MPSQSRRPLAETHVSGPGPGRRQKTCIARIEGRDHGHIIAVVPRSGPPQAGEPASTDAAVQAREKRLFPRRRKQTWENRLMINRESFWRLERRDEEVGFPHN